MLANPPSGIKRGIPTRSEREWKEERQRLQVPRLRDVWQTIPESEWLDRLRDPDLPDGRKRTKEIYDQDGVGSCASESCNGLVDMMRIQAGMPWVLLNPWGMYGRVNGGYDGGSSLQANIAFAKQYGCFPDSVWPRSKGWRATPSDAAYEAASMFTLKEVYEIGNKAEFATAILLGLWVYFGYSGHAIVGAYLIDLLRFGYRNSWGNWGDNGFGSLSFSSIYWGYGAYAFGRIKRTTEEDIERLKRLALAA